MGIMEKFEASGSMSKMACRAIRNLQAYHVSKRAASTEREAKVVQIGSAAPDGLEVTRSADTRNTYHGCRPDCDSTQ